MNAGVASTSQLDNAEVGSLCAIGYDVPAGSDLHELRGRKGVGTSRNRVRIGVTPRLQPHRAQVRETRARAPYARSRGGRFRRGRGLSMSEAGRGDVYDEINAAYEVGAHAGLEAAPRLWSPP